MDALSEVLSNVRLKGAVFFTAELSAPWGLAAPRATDAAPLLAPGARHLVIHHFVLDGTAQVGLVGEDGLDLSPGDIVVFPHGDAHHLGVGRGGVDIGNEHIQHKIANRDLTPCERAAGARRRVSCAATCRAIPICVGPSSTACRAC